jgi:Icc-related predicted phosphoesterase
MKLAWATDVHLNFVDEKHVAELCERIDLAEPAALLLGGDIAEAPSLEPWLRFLEAHLSCPIYFVLGNHDYYGGEIESVRARMRDLKSDRLRWLPATGLVRLTESTALVGHGGWGDGRLGDFMASAVVLADYLAIHDLFELLDKKLPLGSRRDKKALATKLRKLGDDAARALKPSLARAAREFADVVVLTHVPPVREACVYQGKISSDDWLPGFTCKAVGDLIEKVARKRAGCRFTVLCGHTHEESECQPFENVRILTGGADYEAPDFRILEVPD